MVYALGATLHWQMVAWLAIILPIMSLLSFLLLPESPVWLVRNNRVEEASKALNWLRGGGKQVCYNLCYNSFFIDIIIGLLYVRPSDLL